ncbi:MAG: AsmA family protein [Acidobacteriota bacterium]|nr:AsmA family protein [Acidobacteriota bacterium]
MRKGLLILAGVVVVLLVAMLALAMLVNADHFRPQVEQQATAALGRQVTIGKLKLALFAGGITAEKLSVADDPQFSNEPFLTADSMAIGVDLHALIFSRKLNVKSFTLHAPSVHLVQNAKGDWNYATLGSKTASTAPKDKSATPDFVVGKFLLDDGKVSVLHLENNHTSAYTKLKMEATDVTLKGTVPYSFSASAPGGGTVEAKGLFGPLAEDVERTPVTATVTVKGFDISASGFTDPGSPMKGIVDLTADVQSDGTKSEVVAHVTGNKMCLVEGCSAASTVIALDVNASYLLADKLATLSSSQLRFGKSTASISGTVNLKAASPKVDAKVDANSLAVGDIEGVLPAVAVVLPPGAKLEGGTAALHASAAGPASAMTIKAHVALSNSKLTGYDLNSKMSVVTHLTGITVNKETPIQEFSADALQNSDGTKVDNLLLNMPGLAKVTGSGTIGKKNELNFTMKAVVDISHSAVGKVNAVFGKKSTNLPVPFHVGGTAQDPKITPDVGVPGVSSLTNAGTGAASTVKDSATKAVSGLGGLFGKKKK